MRPSLDHRTQKTQLRGERLENRCLLAVDIGHNFLTPHDVNDDRLISPLDALVVINQLNAPGQTLAAPAGIFMTDVSDDGLVSPLDVLQVVNVLNRPTSATTATQEDWMLGSGGARAGAELETEAGEVELSIKLTGAAANHAYPVLLNDIALGEIVTDGKGRGRIKLSRGDDNSRHQPLPDALGEVTNDMELVIGELVSGRLGGALQTFSNQTLPTTAVPSAGAANNNVNDNLIALHAAFTRGQYSAEYEVDERRGQLVREFEVEAQGLRSGETLDVSVEGTLIATLTADSRGRAKLKLSSAPKDSSELQMPANFPLISVGTPITIGLSNATFNKI